MNMKKPLRANILCELILLVSLLALAVFPGDVLAEEVRGEDLLELEDLIYESGPYPRMLSLSIPGNFPKKGNEWKVAVIERLTKDGLAIIDENSGARMQWHPANDDDSMVRTNYDRNYEKLDYSVVLGSLDAEILSTNIGQPSKNSSSTAGEAKLKETLEANPLYSKLLRLLPAEIQKTFTAREKTVRFQKQSGTFALVGEKDTPSSN